MHDIDHLSADGSNLSSLSVCGLLDLVWSLLGESDGKDAEEVVISRLDGDVGLDQRLPFSDERSELV